jgi:MoaA/NifB/PqqE/SkfB family radical SAM enzyme
MLNDKFIICIGDGTEYADVLAQDIAQLHGLKYHGVFDNNTILASGVYHTSIYDIKLQELKDVINFNDVLITVLDIPATAYKYINDYYTTINLAHGVERIATVDFINPKMSNPARQLVTTNKSICAMPFVSVFKKEDKIKSCCFMENNKFLQTTTIDIDAVKQQMIDGVRASTCEYCYNLDDQGVISPRQTYTINWANKLNLKSPDDIIQQSIVDYDIRLNNECNALCRSCNPYTSNLIAREYFKINLIGHDVGYTPKTNYDIINLETVQRIYVSGGEPTIQNTLVDFLQKCINANKTDFEIVINTNAAVVSDKFITLVKQFSNLKFEISIDGYGNTNQYIRWPIKWDKFTRNIKTLYDITNGKITFNTVVSIYNVGQLYSIFEFLENTYPASRYDISFLIDPISQRPWNFPNKKLAVTNLTKIKELQTYQKDEVFKSQIDSAIKQMENSDTNILQLTQFFEFNDRLDASRDVILVDYIPELEQCRDLITKPT